MTGLSTAYHLAKQGFLNVLLDARGVCEAATARNGGHMWPATTYPSKDGNKFNLQELFILSFYRTEPLWPKGVEKEAPISNGHVQGHDRLYREVQHRL